jgi:hypothetical protein
MPGRGPQSGSLPCGRDAWGDVNASISAVEGFSLVAGRFERRIKERDLGGVDENVDFGAPGDDRVRRPQPPR